MAVRLEQKYVISVFTFLAIRKQFEALMFSDKYSGSEGYKVRSLYFDSILDTDLHDSLDGVLTKGKIRLRIYGHDDQQVKLEYKRKHGTDGFKHVLKLTRKQARDMINGDYSFLPGIDDPLALKLYTRMIEGSYRPVSLIEYNRRAYTYPVNNVRVTFDSDIRTSCVPDAFFDEYPALFPMGDVDKGVLEVKYENFLPSIVKDLIHIVDRIHEAYSKYMYSRLFY